MFLCGKWCFSSLFFMAFFFVSKYLYFYLYRLPLIGYNQRKDHFFEKNLRLYEKNIVFLPFIKEGIHAAKQ